MRTAYRVLAYLVAVGVAVQAASIAVGTFGLLNDIDSGAVAAKSYEENAGFAVHGAAGQIVIPLLAIALLVVSFFAKTIPGGITWAGYVLITTIVQVVLGIVSRAVTSLGVVHGLIAMVLFAVAGLAARRAQQPARPVTASTSVS